MHQYELMAVYPLEEDQCQSGKQKLAADMEAAGAVIEKTDELGDKDLAYEVQKRKRAKYILYTFKVDPLKIAALDKTFKLNANLLKYMFVRLD
jgi:small subunit ribosomal protein S6